MAFPVSPIDGQITEINGVTYQFVSADSAWVRIPSYGNITVGNVTANNIIANANITAGNVYTTNGLFWSGNGVAFSSSGADDILRANVGAFQTYSNTTFTTLDANVGTLFLGNASTQANLGAFQIYANTNFTTLDANVGTLYLGNISTNANLGAFQEYANANIGTLFLGNASTQANLGAFYAYANTKIGNNSNGNLVIAATTVSTNTTTGALVVGGGAGIAGTINVGGNITVGNVVSSLYYSAGGASKFELTDIGLVVLDVASQQYKFGASGIEASPGIFGGSYGGNKLSLNNETALISNRYDTVTIQTGTDGSTQNTWTFGNSALTAPGRITALGNIVAAATTTSTSSTTGALVVAGGIGVAGNVVADKFYTTNGLYWAGNGVAFSSGGGTPAGSNQQIQYNNSGVFGASSGLVYDGVSLKVNGNLESTYHSGDEGGEIFLQKPDTNTTLSAGVTIDVFQNKLRFFENGGTNRGFYLDITSGGATVGTNIMSGGGGGSPAGSTGDVQFNNGGALGATSLFYDSATGNLVLTDTTDSTSTTTGALVVRGGIGVAGNVTANKFYTTVGLFWAGNGVAFSSGSGGGGGGGITYTSDTSPPLSPNIADQWYNTVTDVLYEYIEDGTSSYWVDVQSPMFSSGITNSVVGNVSITGPTSSIGHLTVARTATVSGNIITLSNINVAKSANVLGNLTVGGNVAFSRDATIAANLTVVGNVAAGNITTANITATGNITTVETISSTIVSAANITVTSNVTTANITATNINSTANITSGNIATGNLTVTSNIISSELTSSGNITANNVTITGNATLTGANVYVGNVANLSIGGGTSGQYLQTDGAGDLTWQTLPATNIQEFTATASQTTFTVVGTYTVGSVLVFVNGIQMNSIDYTATDGTTVVLTEPRNVGDTVRIIASFGAASLVSGLTLNVNNLQNFAVAMSIALGA